MSAVVCWMPGYVMLPEVGQLVVIVLNNGGQTEAVYQGRNNWTTFKNEQEVPLNGFLPSMWRAPVPQLEDV